MSEPTEKKARMTVDDITAMLSDIAHDEEAGAQRFQALKMLAGMESATITLPDPMGPEEIDLRLSRLMKGAGPAATQRSYLMAFPDLARKEFGIHMTAATPDMIRRAQPITSLKLLNKEFPEFKMQGMPRGFPVRQSLVAKATWCRDQALKYMIERAAKERKQAHESLVTPNLVPTDGMGATDGSQEEGVDGAETG